MSAREPVIPLESFQTFGDLLKYLRRRARLTQRELCIAVGYSEAQISRLEQNQRPPDFAAIAALFIPALFLEQEPECAARLMELAAQARGESLPRNGGITFARSVQRQVLETTREESAGNLPIALTSFIGRGREIAALQTLLLSDTRNVRLVTLTGSGGCGKTRLALEVGKRSVESYRDGIWLIEFGSISDAGLVLQSAASALGIPESRDDVPTSALINYLRIKKILLLLDNCEHVRAATSQLVEEILRYCPHVQILATSREILNVPGEVQFRVPPLSLADQSPPGHDLPDRPEAVQLFVDRAQVVSPSFLLTEETIPSVTRICRLVDGMPLGIELAAAKAAVLSVEQIARRLDESFQILHASRADLPQHKTLEATIQWSYDLLSEEERTLLQRLSVFSGGWTLEAAESVTSDEALLPEEKIIDLLSALVNKSLVVVDLQSATEARYRLLRVVRQFGLDHLEKPGELGTVQNRHMDFFLDLVERSRLGLMTSQSPYWLRRLDAEQDNLRAAFSYARTAKRIDDALRLAVGLFWFWQTRGHISEGRAQLEQLLDDPSLKGTVVRAQGLWAAGTLAWIQGDYTSARVRLEESISFWREHQPSDRWWLAVSLRELGIISTYQGELGYAHVVMDESISLLQEIGNKWDLALALYNHGLVHESENDFATARQSFQDSLSIFRELNEPWGLSVALCGFGRIAGHQAGYDTARSHLEESLEFSRMIDDLWSNATILYLLGEVARRQSDMLSARKHYMESLRLAQVVGDRALLGFTLHNLGKVAELLGEPQKAARLFGAAQALREASDNTTSWSLTDHAQCEQDIESLRHTLGKESFEQAWIKGQSMNMEQAIAFALGSSRI